MKGAFQKGYLGSVPKTTEFEVLKIRLELNTAIGKKKKNLPGLFSCIVEIKKPVDLG